VVRATKAIGKKVMTQSDDFLLGTTVPSGTMEDTVIE
jgi:hypothetical protein